MYKPFFTIILIITIVALWLFCKFDVESQLKNLESKNIALKSEAIYQLGEEETEEAVPYFIKILQNPEESQSIKTLVVEAIGKIGDKKATSALIEILNETEIEIRVASLNALGMIKDHNATTRLLEILDDRSVLMPAIRTLGDIGDKKAVSRLTFYLNDHDKYIRYNAQQALKRIGHME